MTYFIIRRLLAAASALSACFFAFTPCRAQSAADDPVLSRLQTLGIDSSQTENLAQALMDSIGPRLAGSASFAAASDWLMRHYRNWGIETRTEQYGTWRGWKRGHTHVDLVSPRLRSLEATMLAFSPGTGGADVTAPTVILPLVKDNVEFARWLPNVKGKFVLMSPAYPSCRPESEWQTMATPESKARMDTAIVRILHDWGARVDATGYEMNIGVPTGTLGVALEKAGAAGVIISNMTDQFGEAWGTWAVFETHNARAPAIAMSCEDYGLLFRMTERGQRPVLRVNLDARPTGSSPAFNTFGIINGTEKPNEYVFLSAHLDSWDSSEGATDNGTGTILMMEAMRLLKLAYPHPKRTIMVGHWGGEEVGEIGSRAFAFDHPAIGNAIAAGFNQDGGTGRIQRVWGAGLPDGDTHLRKWLTMLPEKVRPNFAGSHPYVGNTDHRSFTCYGAPFFLLNSVRWDNDAYTQHTNRDSFDKIVFDDLKQNATVVAMLAYVASEDPTFIDRTRADLNAPSPSPTGGASATPSQPVTMTRAELSEKLFPWKPKPGATTSNSLAWDNLGWITTCPNGPRFFGDSSNVRAPSRR
ncbi:MAG TPA: M28 family peptidase [Gemmatimonadaceae bacterium]|jgi:carboxypeptidase Q